MEELEIGIDKKSQLSITAYLIALSILQVYFTYYTDIFADNVAVQNLGLPVALMFLVFAYGFGRKAFNKGTVIRLSKKFIEVTLNDKQNIYYWKNITKLSFKSDKDGKNWMYINTSKEEKAILLNSFEKSFEEIQSLVVKYQGHAEK